MAAAFLLCPRDRPVLFLLTSLRRRGVGSSLAPGNGGSHQPAWAVGIVSGGSCHSAVTFRWGSISPVTSRITTANLFVTAKSLRLPDAVPVTTKNAVCTLPEIGRA